MRKRNVAPIVVVIVALAACAKVAGIDDLAIGACKGGGCEDEAADSGITIGDSDGSIDPESEGGGGFDASKPCPGTSGPTMVRVGTAANNFCIDHTEVSVKDYAAFTSAKGNDVGGQSAQCAWNTSFAPTIGGDDDLPIAGVDWCDAKAYCQWAGKRLCGKHKDNTFQGSVTEDGLGEFTTHEWMLACSNVGQLKYPYGGTQVGTACNTGENDAGRTLPVGSKTSCQGGFAGLYDMVGNLWEWFDGPCVLPEAGADGAIPDAGPAKDECFVKGGAYLNVGAMLDCRVDGRGATRDHRGPEIGLRCCSD